jgi:hypothetical protein
LQQLLKGGWDDAAVFAVLCDRAVNDPFVPLQDGAVNPRLTALEAIVQYYGDHPETLPLLRDRAQSDPDEKVRAFAQSVLATPGKN